MAADEPRFPAGLPNVFVFAIFNALSFQIVLGGPMVLYAKSLGASATVLGIITGMMPLLVIFQIPAARHVSRVGYKRFVFAGWGTRVGFIFAIALFPLASGFLDVTTRLVLVMAVLFAFNLSRGISSAAWLPWITTLVPEALRGRYLTREAGFVNIGSFLSFLLAALYLGNQPSAWQFSALFGFSAVMGVASLYFLKRIPEPEMPEQHGQTSTEPVPWRAIGGYPPFRKLLRMNVAWSVANGGLGTFVVVFLKSVAGMSEGRVLLAMSAAFLGGLASLALLGTRLDRVGSKPIITASLLAWFGIVVGWVLLAAHVWPTPFWLACALQFLMGLAGSLVGLANTRLAMAIVPPMGRNHFFALFSVVGSLTLGVSPIVWGLLIDALAAVHHVWHGFEVNAYSLFFAGVAVTFLVTLWFCRRLDEPQAASLDELLRDLLQQSPLRELMRFWPRG